MKKICLAVLCVLCLVSVALAEPVSLAWDPNSDNVTGYRLYARTGNTYDYANPIWEGSLTTCTVDVAADLQTAFVVRAYRVLNLTGEVQQSGDSNEVIYTPDALANPPSTPNGLFIKAIEEIIQGLETLKKAIANS